MSSSSRFDMAPPLMNRIIEEDLQAIVAAPLPWSKLAGKTVLISGAGGFLPAYLVRTLLALREKQNPTRVIGLVRDEQRARLRFGRWLDLPDLRLLVQDVSQPVQLDEPVDFIIHAASQASPKFYGSDPVGTLEANLLGTHHLLSLARRHESEGFLFFSSGEVYGQLAPDQVPTREDQYGLVDPTQVRSCYAEGKRAAETLCVSYHHQHGVPAKIVRPFHTYGPGMSLDDGRVYADFVADIVAGRNIVMKSDGGARRAFCYLADATIGFFGVLLGGEAGQAYNVGNEEMEESILGLARRLVRLFPDKGLRVVEQPKPAEETGYLQSPIARNCPDTSKVRRLGWKPTTSIEEGFGRTVESFLT